MKVLWKEICVAILMGTVLPSLILNISAVLLEGNAKELPIVESTSETYAAGESAIPVFVLFPGGSVKTMDMDMYLTGVVLGEMPADFENEALKAQAVAARTYTAKAKLGDERGEQLAKLDAGIAVEPHKGIVHHQHAWGASQGTCELELAQLTAAERDDVFIIQVVQMEESHQHLTLLYQQ